MAKVLTFFKKCDICRVKIREMVEDKKLPQKMPIYKIACSKEVDPIGCPTTSEQMVLNFAFTEMYPSIQLDYKCEIFQVVNDCDDVSFYSGLFL